MDSLWADIKEKKTMVTFTVCGFILLALGSEWLYPPLSPTPAIKGNKSYMANFHRGSLDEGERTRSLRGKSILLAELSTLPRNVRSAQISYLEYSVQALLLHFFGCTVGSVAREFEDC
jgi:hypothetical protein